MEVLILLRESYTLYTVYPSIGEPQIRRQVSVCVNHKAYEGYLLYQIFGSGEHIN